MKQHPVVTAAARIAIALLGSLAVGVSHASPVSGVAAPVSISSFTASAGTISPGSTTSYVLMASGHGSHASSTVTVHVTLALGTTTCPGGTQGHAYQGCCLHALGGTPPYQYAVSANSLYAPLPEGLALNTHTGVVSGTYIGGQGTYIADLVVTDAAGATVDAPISFAINGNNAFMAGIFPADSIFHHRVDAASTGLPVDTSPAAPILSDYQPARMHPTFGTEYANYPNGIPAISVPHNQALVEVSTTEYQSYFTSAPIPAYAPVQGTLRSDGDRHVLVFREAGAGAPPALYELWQGIYQQGPWTDSSNALWANTNSYALTPLGNGTADAAGLPETAVLLNADEVIGTGTPSAPNGTVRHPTLFTVGYTLNNYVWPATTSASGLGSTPGYGCSNGSTTIPAYTELSQTNPPTSCGWSGPSGEIYRLKASTPTPDCALPDSSGHIASPQAAIIITGLRNYGIILGDNGAPNGSLAGTPDARWNQDDIDCIFNLYLSDFEPVNVSSLMVSADSAATTH